MSELSKDEGVIVTLIDRMLKLRLPRARAIQARVEAGERLTDTDIDFLKEISADSDQVMALAHRNPEWQEVYAQAIHLYKSIMEKALENEKAAGR